MVAQDQKKESAKSQFPELHHRLRHPTVNSAATGLLANSAELANISDEWAPGPIDAEQQPAELLFDGERLIAFDPDDGSILNEWDAVSGIRDESSGSTDADRCRKKRGANP